MTAPSNDGTDLDTTLQELVAAVQTHPRLSSLPSVLLKAYNEMAEVLTGIRITRETIQHQALDQLQDTQERLNLVSSATESAAMEIMNGLDRTLGLLDRLDARPDGDREALAALREEINQLFGHLQFQDIITQQLRGVMALVMDVERRIASVAALFDQSLGSAVKAVAPVSNSDAFNPDAVWDASPDRQAAVDAAFAKKGP
jgi:chemotaxis regulatin CheY-phosphate phosphatase CheZ